MKKYFIKKTGKEEKIYKALILLKEETGRAIAVRFGKSLKNFDANE